MRASSLEPAQVLDVDRSDVAEEKDENRQADCRLGGSDGQNEEHEDLAGGVVEIMRERDEIQIDREQHQLDRHQQDDDVAPVQEYSDHADGEQKRPQHEVM